MYWYSLAPSNRASKVVFNYVFGLTVIVNGPALAGRFDVIIVLHLIGYIIELRRPTNKDLLVSFPFLHTQRRRKLRVNILRGLSAPTRRCPLVL
jgi:hypothetical protein